MKACCHTSFFLNYPIEEVLRRLGDAGYKGVEISALSECGTFTPELLHQKRIDQFRRSAEIAGLEIVSYDCELLPPLGRNLASPSKTVRERTKDYILSSISTARNIGARFVVISAGMTMYGVMKEKAWPWLIEGLEECMTYAEKENIYILLEHTTMLEGNMVVTLHDLQSLLTAIGSHYLLPLIDTGHVFVNGESITDYVLNLKSSVRHIHVDDNDGRSDDHLPPGDGMFDFDPLFHTLMKIRYEGYLSVEPSFAFSSDPDSAALKGLKFINEYVERITGSQ